MKKKAVFITIEGIEGCGKSSVIKHLYKIIKKKKYNVRIFREPGTTRIGEKLRLILLDKKNKELSPYTELLLYLAARTQLIEEKLKDALERYDFVVCDRFFDSTLVYQGVALGLGKLVDKSVEMFSLKIKPDLTLFLDVPVNLSLKRLKSRDRIESRSLNFHNKLRKGFLRLAKKYPGRIKIIDASRLLAEVYKQVERRVSNYLLR